MTAAEKMLAAKGVKPTPQRMVIAEYILNTHCHPTADDVFAAVSDKLPVPLSRATVYNTLNVLVDAGVIKEVFTEPGKTRYDANTSHHHHFIDVKTGKVIDISKDMVPKLTDKLGRKFKVHNYQITFFGELSDDA
jgi:Fe2+ or Zn2+ uptake regulation protein